MWPRCGTCHQEAAIARALGVKVHPIYIGEEDYPDVLLRLAAETRGVMFRAWQVLHEDDDGHDGARMTGARICASRLHTIRLETVTGS